VSSHSPIPSPPPELVEQWVTETWHEGTTVLVAASDAHIATQAARWGAARALLAQPVAKRPTDKELWTAGSDDFRANCYPSDAIAYARAVLARWGHPTPQPVAVGERLPGPKDVNEDGEVWIIEEGYSYALGDTGDYDWEPHRIVLRSIGEFDAKNGRTWLPANDLPTPRGHQ